MWRDVWTRRRGAEIRHRQRQRPVEVEAELRRVVAEAVNAFAAANVAELLGD
jgi:hypothetical protein